VQNFSGITCGRDHFGKLAAFGTFLTMNPRGEGYEGRDWLEISQHERH
jgi:hypothetical protein